jgi:two-component system sensor histidine kinase YesM
MGKRFISLKYKIWVWAMLLVLIPGVAMLYISYHESKKQIYERTREAMLNYVSQVGNNVQFVFDDMRALSLFLIQSNDVRDFMSVNAGKKSTARYSYKTCIELLTHLGGTKRIPYSIYIKGFNGMSLSTMGIYEKISDEIIEKAKRAQGMYFWHANQIDITVEKDVNVISLIRLERDINNISNELGILKINVRENVLSKLFSNKIQAAHMYLIDEEGYVLSTEDKSRLGTGLRLKFPDITAGEGDFTVDTDAGELYVAYYPIHEYGMTLVSTLPLDRMVESHSLPLAFGVGLLISFLLCTLVTIVFSVVILKNLDKLRQMIKNVEEERFDNHIAISSNDEIGLVADSFNKMSARMKFLINEVYAGKIKRREAEILSLQTQIDPHFMYNVLDTICWVARMEKAADTAQLITALSRLFRMSVRRRSALITLREEKEYLENYLIIQRKRYHKAIEFHLDIPQATLDYMVINKSLQPLVENAIYHGIERNGGKGDIDIIAQERDGILRVTIRDSGGSLPIEEVEQLLGEPQADGRGLALNNVNDRIRIHFGEAYGLEFRVDTGIYTEVTIKHPAVKKGELPHDQAFDR